ncbi:MAG TPA: hypothetical protein DEB40_02960 [Elusimicrobia bacterium]|nr:hypothetical protein [Elusimicrobiota bacterium]HBT60691.1 hypothetical protein [Elusimicrobiota bacterium]
MISPLAAILVLAGTSWSAEDHLPLPPAEPHLEFVADHLDYDRASAVIHLKGNVRIKESTWTIKGDELWLDTQLRRGRSQGYLLVEDGVSALYGDAGEFDFAEHTGKLRNVSAGFGDWRVHAKSMSLDVKRRLDYRQADFTSCSFDPRAHYHFHASRVGVVPRKHMFARNVVFYVGRVPVFYMPFLYKSLATTHFLRFKVQPGYDRRNGGFLKSTLTNQHGLYWRSKLFLDYYSSQGFGAGGELYRRKEEDSRGVLGGYHIRETGNSQRRWSVTGDLYQALSSSFSLQGRLQVMSDADFNNHYARSSPFRVTPDLLNSGALTYRLPQATARLSYSRQDTADASRTKFVRVVESSPRLDVQSAQMRFWRLPWLNTLSAFADNSFDRNRSFIEKSAGASWEGTRVFLLGRGVSFTPKLGYGQTYYNRVDALTSFATTSTVRDSAVGRYTAAGTLRLSTLAGDSDLTHSYQGRQKAGAMADDAGAVDHGVEINLMSLTHAYRPHRAILVRLASGYDFRVFRDHVLSTSRRVQPIVSEILYTPRSDLDLSVREDYQILDGNRSLIFNGSWGDEDRTHLAGGVGYNLGDSGRYFINTEFGWANSTGTLQLTAALRSQVLSHGGLDNLHGFQAFEKEFSLVKQWHDFFTRLSARLRPGGVKEASVRVDLRFGSFSADRQKVHDWESEWFPERAQGREERP